MSFFKENVSFSSKFGSLFSVVRDNSSVFLSQYYITWRKKSLKVQIFNNFECSSEIKQILKSFMKPQVTFPSKFGSIFSIMTHDSPVFFLAQILYTMAKKSPIKCKFWNFEVLDQNSLNSSCLFQKHKSVSLQFLHVGL